MKTDFRVAMAILAVVVFLIVCWIISMYKLSKECAAKGGVLVQGVGTYVCVPAAGEKK